MHSETPPRLRLLAGGRTHQSRTREQLAQQLGRDATLACAWITHLNQRRAATTRTREAIATAAAFATWCEQTSAELASTDRVDIDALADEWRRRANESGIYGRAWYIDATLMLSALAALLGVYVAGLMPAGLITGAAVITAAILHLRTTPRLLVGPEAPAVTPMWGLP